MIQVVCQDIKCKSPPCEEADNYGYISLKDLNEHKPLWPLKPIEYVATILLIVILVLTNAAGIGGGGAILPIIMLYGFTTTEAVSLSNFVIFVGCIARYFFEFNQAHPYRKAKLIDYGIVIAMLPAVMIGSFIGVQINVIGNSLSYIGC